MASQSLSGWRLQTNWSKTFSPTGTHVALAGYRYSTEGYRDYGDVLGERSVTEGDTAWRSDTLRQRNQFTATINQTLGGYGNLWCSGSMMDYYDDRGNSTQLQAGYNTTLGRVALGVSFSRQNTWWRNGDSTQAQKRMSQRSHSRCHSALESASTRWHCPQVRVSRPGAMRRCHCPVHSIARRRSITRCPRAGSRLKMSPAL